MAELDALIAEATVDCCDEDEQILGLYSVMVDERRAVPFTPPGHQSRPDGRPVSGQPPKADDQMFPVGRELERRTGKTIPEQWNVSLTGVDQE